MTAENRKDFDKEAAQWDSNPGRVRLASDVGAAIIAAIPLTKDTTVIDFGCGTGLLTLKLQPLVKSITGVDNSPGMLAMLKNKIAEQDLGNVLTQHVDFEKGQHVSGQYDLIVSSMVLHHIPDTAELFKEWLGLLRPNGQVCFADLDTEDGAFHGDNTGVHHLGFDRAKLKQLLLEAGYCEVCDTTATIISKEVDGKQRTFPIFLITAKVRSLAISSRF
ncbi:MAG: class I SAM-dependent methyltransferase [Gallionella sp.]